MLGMGALICDNIDCGAEADSIVEDGTVATEGPTPVESAGQKGTVEESCGCDTLAFGKLTVSFEDSTQSNFVMLDSIESVVRLPSLSSPDVSIIENVGRFFDEDHILLSLERRLISTSSAWLDERGTK